MNDIFDRIWEQKTVFFSTFFVVFSLSYVVLMAIDFVPESPTEVSEEESNENSAATEAEEALNDSEEAIETLEEAAEEDEEDSSGENVDAVSLESAEETKVAEATLPVLGLSNTERIMPNKIAINKLDRTVAVLNPQSRTIANLDAALLDGVVRHPDSAALGEEGNVFLLGHSSYLPVVINKNFQAFNGIQDLQWGDTIELYANGTVFEYEVERVYRARAQDVTVPIAGKEKRLTLATCNSFGSTDDRYIVEARQIQVRTL